MERVQDRELADRLMARDERALAEAIETYGSAVYGVARRVITEDTFAQEVAQDTFLALWRRPGAFDPQRGSLLRFLCAIARNKAVDLVRKEESQRRSAEALISETHPGRAVTHMPQLEEQDHMMRALKEITESQREALVLAYFGGRTYREVAEELGIPEGTAKTRLRDGLIKLRGVLAGDKP
ncbi:MAG TPA: sigma-70 family RNA polymerase sigma factor [Actinomycetota bacterium]|nr:sigma-70 family RNA polymerase sigma factor [Actinomycetota bacterium]